MKWTMFVGHAVFAASALITIAIGFGFRWLRSRRLRRLPLHERKIGHLPGQQLLERISKHDEEISLGIDMMLLALPILFMIWASFWIDWSHVRVGIVEAIFAAAWPLFFGYGFYKYQRHYRLREQARDGLVAERVTGMQLNRLVAKGCIVLHDIPAEVGNIDHVVIAPQGVFAVETKSFRKPRKNSARQEAAHRVEFDGQSLRFPDFANTEAVDQAQRGAEWVARYLREVLATDIPVFAALALPGWYIVRTQESRRAAVRVFTPMGRGADFFANPSDRLDTERRSLIAQALAVRYPQLAG